MHREEDLANALERYNFASIEAQFKFRVAVAVVGILEQIAMSIRRYVVWKTGRGE